MQLAVIAPTPALELTHYGDFYFVLAHRVLLDETYEEFYRKASNLKPIMLDNGVFEKGQPLSTEEIMQAAKLISASEVVAPDFPLKKEKTLDAARNFINSLSLAEVERFRIVLLPHGRNFSELVDCYRIMTTLSPFTRAKVIGFSIIDMYKISKRLRPMFIHYLLANEIWCDRVQHHLFGLDEPLELFSYGSVPIRSVDTSLPVSLAYYNERLDVSPPTTPRVPDNAQFTKKKQQLAISNIKRLKEICSRGESVA